MKNCGKVDAFTNLSQSLALAVALCTTAPAWCCAACPATCQPRARRCVVSKAARAYAMTAFTPTIPATSLSSWTGPVDAPTTQERMLDQFLKGVERRALRMAELATMNRDEALDLVQDAMFGFVRHYAAKPAQEWAPLFYRVLDSRLNDWHRRRTVRSRWLAVFTRTPEDEETDEMMARIIHVMEKDWNAEIRTKPRE